MNNIVTECYKIFLKHQWLLERDVKRNKGQNLIFEHGWDILSSGEGWNERTDFETTIVKHLSFSLFEKLCKKANIMYLMCKVYVHVDMHLFNLYVQVQ